MHVPITFPDRFVKQNKITKIFQNQCHNSEKKQQKQKNKKNRTEHVTVN